MPTKKKINKKSVKISQEQPVKVSFERDLHTFEGRTATMMLISNLFGNFPFMNNRVRIVVEVIGDKS